MLLVLDANELFSAMIAKSETLNLFFDGKLTLVSPEFILEEFKEHKSEIMEKSSLDDIEYLALALKLNCPIWSEDKRLKKQTLVKIINTTELIRELG